MANSFNVVQQASDLGPVLAPSPSIFDLFEDSGLSSRILHKCRGIAQGHSHNASSINRSSELRDFGAFEHTAPTDTEDALLECLYHTDDRYLSPLPRLEQFKDVDLFFNSDKTEKAGRFTNFMRVDGGDDEHFETVSGTSDSDEVKVQPTISSSDAELDDDMNSVGLQLVNMDSSATEPDDGVILIDKTEFKPTASRVTKASRTPRAKTFRVNPYNRPARRSLERPGKKKFKDWNGIVMEWNETEEHLAATRPNLAGKLYWVRAYMELLAWGNGAAVWKHYFLKRWNSVKERIKDGDEQSILQDIEERVMNVF